MKYRKKPVEIEAFMFYFDPMPDWFMNKVSTNEIKIFNCEYFRHTSDEAYCHINTLEGVMEARGGDYIIKGVKGEIYPCKADIFEMTYEKVNGG
jgi:sulfatase maturation enzyme AslB (radical SAM superfamily)